jgi:hypothetical protein
MPTGDVRLMSASTSLIASRSQWWDYAKRYGAAMVFALVGNANKVHAMRYVGPDGAVAWAKALLQLPGAV